MTAADAGAGQQLPRVASCSCGSVALWVNSPVIQVAHCHCAGCRAAVGAAFSTWGCVPLVATHFSAWSTLKLHRRNVDGSSPRANRYFCSDCGCSVAMNYPASGKWPEPNTLWLSAAFLGDAPGADVIHMYPEERPGWCAIDPAGCDDEALTYMGADHTCVVRDVEPEPDPLLVLGGRAGVPGQDPAAIEPVAPRESFRLRGPAPAPEGLPGSAALVLHGAPAWVDGGGAPPSPEEGAPGRGVDDGGFDWRVRSVGVRGLRETVSIFEVAAPTETDGCDVDSPRGHLCGAVLWPGARSAAEALLAAEPAGKRVVELGAGTGLVSLVAASVGAAGVLATDASTATLELIEAAAAAQDLAVTTAVLDLLDAEAALPDEVDIVVAADLLYSEELARGVARTCARLARERGAKLIVSDSQYRWADAFVDELSACMAGAGGGGAAGAAAYGFEKRSLGKVTGWSYADGADATYEVSVGVLETEAVAAAAAAGEHASKKRR